MHWTIGVSSWFGSRCPEELQFYHLQVVCSLCLSFHISKMGIINDTDRVGLRMKGVNNIKLLEQCLTHKKLLNLLVAIQLEQVLVSPPFYR